MGFSSSSGFDADGSSGGLFLGWSHRVNVNVVSVSENIIFCNVISEHIVNKTRVWCLDYKKEAGITWNKFEENLSTLQSNIHDEQSASIEVKERLLIKERAAEQWQYWKQRSKSKWDAFGDQSTAFFYKSVKSRSCRNDIRAIKNDQGIWRTKKEEIQSDFFDFYNNLFAGTPSISQQHHDILIKPFSKEDIKVAAFSSKPLKSPGPDGVPPIFFQKYWATVGDDICAGVQAFFSSGHMLRETNKTFVALILKEQRPSTVGGYRPISLCNSTYKIISKCMVNRIKQILPDLVGETQNAFVLGRMMVDNCFVAHEVINHVKRRKKGGRFEAILKVDLSKAYDRVRWDFVIEILKKMKFPDKWVQWILECISSVTYSILVNGEPSKQITPGTGLRQGDPLSPYLFILVMEVLSLNIMKLEQQGQIQGIKISRNAPSISHLFFADDALFCFKATPNSCRRIRECIDGFCSVSGEMINFGKSTVLFSPNTPTRFARILRRPLGVENKKEMGTYLGCPMDVDGRSSAKFQVIVDRVNDKIGSWKFNKVISGGKLLLINSVLIAMASHILSTYLCPAMITKKLNSTLLRYWRASSSTKKPIYWRKKELLYSHKNDGGMGLKEVRTLNVALLARKSWRMHTHSDLLASKLFKGKYGNDPISLGYSNSMPRRSSWAARSLIKAAHNLRDGVRFLVNNGRNTRITQDIWVGDTRLTPKTPLMSEQPNLHVVADLMTTERRWNASLIWRKFSHHDAKRIMATHIPEDEEPDTLNWGGTKNSEYTFKSGYWHQQVDPPSPSYGSIKFWKTLWKLNIFPRWKHFCWKIIHRVLPTRINLRKRGIQVEGDCPMCNNGEETEVHIFRLCPIAQMAWRASNLGIISESQASVTMHDWIINFLNFFHNQDGREEDRVVQLISIAWGIWLHRNEIIFRGVSANPSRILEIAQSHVQRWKHMKDLQERCNALQNSPYPNLHKPWQIIIWKIGRCNSGGFFSIVVDAAWKRKKKVKQKEWEAAIAWAEDGNQSSLCSGAKRIFSHDALQAECYAILEGMKMAGNISRNVLVKTDCKQAVEALKNAKLALSNISSILNQIRREAYKLDYFVCMKFVKEILNLLFIRGRCHGQDSLDFGRINLYSSRADDIPSNLHDVTPECAFLQIKPHIELPESVEEFLKHCSLFTAVCLQLWAFERLPFLIPWSRRENYGYPIVTR
ncbi:uncharacterized protein [Spinacia oleracea]|uniref:Reverse transcriptase domain-containing protein n=1 Tax=Spinacia oleracea TaxID=3562 RepID=A0A9R0JH15_SPIOL|nr:uncharacterized protein LOC110774796 [Spinacia oleracea]